MGKPNVGDEGRLTVKVAGILVARDAGTNSASGHRRVPTFETLTKTGRMARCWSRWLEASPTW